MRDRIGGPHPFRHRQGLRPPAQLGSWLSGPDEAAVLRARLLSLGLTEIDLDTGTGWTADGETASLDTTRSARPFAVPVTVPSTYPH